MNKDLVIVFVKNIKPGHVKTRLAKTIGNDAAITIYKALLNITETVTKKLESDLLIAFSEHIDDNIWAHSNKTVQQGGDLGERMKNAFQNGFNKGYERIILIGSDLPNLTANHINSGLEKLKKNTAVFGPAEDGGYYLIGLSQMQPYIFENKPWSETHLLELTLTELNKKQVPFATLDTLNDIDTIEDLIQFPELFKLIS
ncbi:TIGR04282 family arsenosugar biosynthesis glycosyltransferase [Tamlana sp. I1]|uniref:TIGR04282 family arsenosugar biosynthesis glycosyltransferase n=1 Tax=Tamlana sp. I1 TaxID=2762061 RepID=UPI00188FEA1A|nr:TIGR04282 family arsenosugar biosynthesis glycosyltransferase [Tamlana sp. I1]